MFASVLRRPSPGRHRAFYVEDGPPFAEPEDETLTDDDESTTALEDEG